MCSSRPDEEAALHDYPHGLPVRPLDIAIVGVPADLQTWHNGLLS